MPDYVLESRPPLAGYEKSFGDITLSAPADLALVSIALPLGGEAAAMKAIKAAYGSDLPEVGKSCATAKGDATLLRMASDQALVMFTHTTPDAERVVAGKLKGAAYTTDQTDVWCALEISGTGAVRALERICPLDLHDNAFAVNDVARTMMEHLGVIILRTDPEGWLLLSASSSAGSFLHALETSITNVS
ncbi:sarcosine oxidase subunit gamma [Roseovarius sp. 2305UL8-3]|uniref:sarcosine oxidase subunit gamma n=1 Tax=Roseovarius conchicola TaxID=3121636 RepID=UPI003528DAD5